MLTAISALNAWAVGWLGAIFAVLWQSTLLIAIASLVAWFLRRSSPVVRYWLWQIVAIKLLLMPFWTFAVPWPAWTTHPARENSAAISSPAQPGRDSEGAALRKAFPMPEGQKAGAVTENPSFWEPLRAIAWQTWLFLSWFVVVVWLFLRILIQRRRLSRLLNRGRPVSGDYAALVAELSAQIGLRRPPKTVSVEGDCPLFVCGLWRPVLVLPSQLLDSLETSQRRQVILHELGHVKRRDLPWGWPVEIARIIYFFHPLVYWVAYQLRLERELACDQLAMARSGHSAADYAQTLVQVVSHASTPTTAQTAAIAAGLTGTQSASKRESKPLT